MQQRPEAAVAAAAAAAAVAAASLQHLQGSAGAPPHAAAWRPQVRGKVLACLGAAAVLARRCPRPPQTHASATAAALAAVQGPASALRQGPAGAAAQRCQLTLRLPLLLLLQLFAPQVAVLGGGLPSAATQDTSLASGGTNGADGGARNGRGERDSRQLALNKRKVGPRGVCVGWDLLWGSQPRGGWLLIISVGIGSGEGSSARPTHVPGHAAAGHSQAPLQEAVPWLSAAADAGRPFGGLADSPPAPCWLQNLKFGKTIRYESRKALAQQRPWVKGQFVKHCQQGWSQVGAAAAAVKDMAARRCLGACPSRRPAWRGLSLAPAAARHPPPLPLLACWRRWSAEPPPWTAGRVGGRRGQQRQRVQARPERSLLAERRRAGRAEPELCAWGGPGGGGCRCAAG
jgi:hypothetical protein